MVAGILADKYTEVNGKYSRILGIKINVVTSYKTFVPPDGRLLTT